MIWNGEASLRLPRDIQRVARRKLRILNNARTLKDLRVPPANRLEALHGNRKGQHSIRINDNAEHGRSSAAGERKRRSGWRICFVWKDGDAHGVEIVDYH